MNESSDVNLDRPLAYAKESLELVLKELTGNDCKLELKSLDRVDFLTSGLVAVGESIHQTFLANATLRISRTEGFSVMSLQEMWQLATRSTDLGNLVGSQVTALEASGEDYLEFNLNIFCKDVFPSYDLAFAEASGYHKLAALKIPSLACIYPNTHIQRRQMSRGHCVVLTLAVPATQPLNSFSILWDPNTQIMLRTIATMKDLHLNRFIHGDALCRNFLFKTDSLDLLPIDLEGKGDFSAIPALDLSEEEQEQLGAEVAGQLEAENLSIADEIFEELKRFYDLALRYKLQTFALHDDPISNLKLAFLGGIYHDWLLIFETISSAQKGANLDEYTARRDETLRAFEDEYLQPLIAAGIFTDEFAAELTSLFTRYWPASQIR